MQDVDRRSGVYAIYKSKGCAKFSQLPPQYKRVTSKDGNPVEYVTKNGAILLEAAPGNGDKKNPQWYWDNKITFAIGVADIIKLSEKGDKRLFHEHSDNTKILQFNPGEKGTRWEGTWMLVLTKGRGDSTERVMVPFTHGEFQVLKKLLTDSVSMMLNWS